MMPRLCIFSVAAVIVLCHTDTFASELTEFRARGCAATEWELSESDRTMLLGRHLVHGELSKGSVLVRRAYVTEYDAARRLPRWAAWYAAGEFRPPPKRDGIWKNFHPDPQVPDPVVHGDYTHSGFSRGHIVPYYISGGDRNGNGKDAECSVEDQERGMDEDCLTVERRPVQDPYDACTVFEVNYMSNITPQYQSGFNGSGGLWYELERIVRNAIDREEKAFNLVAGPVFSNDSVRKIGPHSDIHVPHSFFKVVIHDGMPLAFLFAHDREANGPGCPLHAELRDCVVSVDKVEMATGLDFFSELQETEQHSIESRRNLELWGKLIKWAKL